MSVGFFPSYWSFVSPGWEFPLIHEAFFPGTFRLYPLVGVYINLMGVWCPGMVTSCLLDGRFHQFSRCIGTFPPDVDSLCRLVSVGIFPPGMVGLCPLFGGFHESTMFFSSGDGPFESSTYGFPAIS